MSGLREALSQALKDVFQGYSTPQDGLADIEAALPEHRDEVRALIGDEQVGWRNPDPQYPHEAVPYTGAYKEAGRELGWRPIYAPREET